MHRSISNIRSCRHRFQEHKWKDKTNMFLPEFVAPKNEASWTRRGHILAGDITLEGEDGLHLPYTTIRVLSFILHTPVSKVYVFLLPVGEPGSLGTFSSSSPRIPKTILPPWLWPCLFLTLPEALHKQCHSLQSSKSNLLLKVYLKSNLLPI